ncbi:Cell wall protein RBR3, partial [Candida tropicalis]
MLLPFKRILITAWLLLSSALALDITSDRIDRGVIDLSIGDITIHAPASWSIINNAISTIVGNLKVESGAGFYISSTSPILSLQVLLTSLLESIENDGIIAFNSVASLTSSTFNLVGLSFKNTGEMYMGASGILPSVMSITAASWDNENLMVFYQNQRNSGNVLLGTALGSITNNGNICLFESVYRQTTAIKGSGCITADENSTIYISNSLLSVDTNQNLYLKDSQSSIIAEALSTPQTFNVYGFGNGNKIGVTLPLLGNLLPYYPAYSYDESTGILTLRNLLLTQKFNIGKGYDSDLFKIVTDSGAGLPSTLLGSLQYNGPVPDQSLPSSCQIDCKQLPDAPGTEPTEYTTTITTTASDGSEL